MIKKVDQRRTKITALTWVIKAWNIVYQPKWKNDWRVIWRTDKKKNLSSIRQPDKNNESDKWQDIYSAHLDTISKAKSLRFLLVSVPAMLHNTWTWWWWRNRSESSKMYIIILHSQLQEDSMTDLQWGCFVPTSCESQHISDGNMGKFPLNCI